MNLVKVLAFALCTIQYSSLVAQHVNFQQLGLVNGLPSSRVFAAHQDSRGYLWLATNAGLCRYNGEEIRTYTVSDGLPGNDILGFYEDSQDRLWLYTYNGQPGFVRNDSCFSSANTPWLPKLKARFFTTMVREAPDHRIYFSNGEVHCLQPGKSPQCIRSDPQKLFNSTTMVFHEDRSFSILGVRRLCLYASDNTFIEEVQTPLRASRGMARATDHADGTFTIITEKDLYNWDGKSFEKMPIQLPEDLIAIYKSPDRHFWIGTFSGAYQFDEAWNLIDSVLIGETVSGILNDSEGNYWFTTVGNGVYVTSDPKAVSWGEEEGVGGIYSFAYDSSGNLWASGELESIYQFSNGSFNRFYLGKSKRTFNERRVLRLEVSPNGQIIAIGDGDMFIREGKEFVGYNSNSSKDIAIHPDGSIYTASNHGVLNLDEELLKFTKRKWGEPPFSWNSFPEYADRTVLLGRATALEFDEQGKLYIGNKSGFFTGQEDQNGTWQITTDPLLDESGITDLEFDPEGNLWGVVGGKGVFCRYPDSLVWLNDGKDRIGTMAQRLYIESGEEIWVATQIGLAYLHRRNGQWTWRLIGEREGLISSEVRDMLLLRDTIWIATSSGLTAIPKHNLLESPPSPKIHLTNIYAQGEKISPREILELTYQKRRFSVQFEAISFGTGGQIQYRYRMKGLDSLWSYTTGTEVSFNSLPSGNFIFEVSAQRGAGPWSAPAWIKVIVPRPWWQIWWVWGLIIIGQIVIVWQLFNWRMRRIKRKSEMERRVLISEQTALRAQMNPHFIFNALNSVQQFFLNQKLREGNTFLTKFSQLIRRILENSDQIYLSLEEELEMIRPYMEFESLRSGDKFDFEVQVASDLDPYNTLIPGMLIQPLLENAIWHGIRHLETKGKIELAFSKEAGGIIVQVKDNGIGREKAKMMQSAERKAHRSMGLNLIRDRMEVIKALENDKISLYITDLTNPDGSGAGTIAEIRIISKRYA